MSTQWRSGSGLREAQRTLAGAKDSQIERVVAVIDSMAERGAADQLIAPLRPLLARIRPPRPLRFTRLLFLALDPLIVDAPRWRRGGLTVPRTALEPLAQSVREGMEEELRTAIDRLIINRTTRDSEIVREAGALLWPAASRILCAAPPASAWSATGLPATDYEPLARAIGTALAHASPLRELTDQKPSSQAACEKALEPFLRAAVLHGDQTLGRVVALVLDAMPDAAPVLRLAGAAAGLSDSAVRKAADRGSELLLDRLESDGGARSVSGPTLAEAGDAIRRLAVFLDGIEHDAASPERRSRIAQIRGQVQASCNTRFASALKSDLLDRLQDADAAPSNEMMAQLEITARDLRRLESAARRVGGGDSYDALLRRVSQELASQRTGAGLSLADRVRMIEILTGPDEALALFAAERDGGDTVGSLGQGQDETRSQAIA
jgi:hypothetical protein